MFNKLTPDNKYILSEIDKIVKGHYKAKIALINAFNRSYLRYYQHHKENIHYDKCISNRNVLLLGQSGSGKTYLVEQLANIMEVPLLCIAATELTPSGNDDGVNIKQIRKKIHDYCFYLVQTRPHFLSTNGVIDQLIIFVDEIDKLGSRLSKGWNQHVQSTYLRLFENKDEFTSITFIFAGAFVGLEDCSKSTKIGFSLNNNQEAMEEHLEDDIIDYGIIPELIGRIHSIVQIKPLQYEDYLEVMNTCLIPKLRNELYYINQNKLYISPDEKEKMIKKAMKSNQGIRHLIKSIEAYVEDIEFEVPYKLSI